MDQAKNSGFDIALGNDCSKIAYGYAKQTFANRKGKAGAVGGKVDGTFSNLLHFGDARLGISSDGIGTKIELAERTGIYNTIGFDLVAMTVDDLIAGGFEPTNLSNILDVDHLHAPTVDRLMQGLREAADFASIAVTGGEIAELGNRIGGYGSGMHFNWCATAIGVLNPALAQPLDGSGIRPGHKVIALQSRGFRSNGFSAIRKIMSQRFGGAWHSEPYGTNTGQSWGEALLTPSLVYAPGLAKMFSGGMLPSSVVHITGGGIADNFSRVLKVNRLGCTLDNLHQPLPVMEALLKLGGLDICQAYLYWNMGNGMLLTAPPDVAGDMASFLANEGYKATIAGEIHEQPRIALATSGGELLYDMEWK